MADNSKKLSISEADSHKPAILPRSGWTSDYSFLKAVFKAKQSLEATEISSPKK